MNVLQHPETTDPKDLQIWDNAAFDNGESEGSAAIKFSWSNMNPLSMNLSQSLESDLTKENQSPSMEESPVSVKASAPTKPLIPNRLIANIQPDPISKVGTLERKINENAGQDRTGKERNLDFEIEQIEKEINRLSLRLESLRLEKAKRNAKIMEKRGRIVAAKFMDPPKHSTKTSDEQSNVEESLCMSAKLKTPRRGLSLGPAEIMRGTRRGISLGPAEIYSATKLKQLGKIEMNTPVQPNSNRRKSCYWKLRDIDELRATKERGKSMSLSPKSRLKTVSKAQVPKQAATTIGSRKTVKKEDEVISSVQPKKLFVKDGEKSATAKKPLKSGRVVASRYNQISNGANSAMKELRKRSLPENEEDCKTSDRKRVSLAGKSQGAEHAGTETRVKKRWEIPSEVASQEVEGHKTPLSVSKMLDKVPNIKILRCIDKSPRDSGAAKRVSELVGRKSFFSMDDVDDDDVEESVCQVLNFAEQITKEYPTILVLRCSNESPQDSGAAKQVSQLVGRKSFFDDDNEMPVFSFEQEDDEQN